MPTQREEFAAAEPLLDAICRTGCSLFSVPWTLIHLDLDAGRSGTIGIGLDAWKEGITPSFRKSILLSQEILVVEDAVHDVRFAANPAVDGAPPIRFYAGAPLFMAPAVHVGTLCLMAASPRTFTREQRQQLEDLAQITSVHLRTQAASRMASEQATLYRLLAENSTDTIVRGNLEGVRLYISPAVRTLLGYEPHELIGRKAREIVHPDDAEEFRGLMESIREGRIDLAVTEHRQRHKDGTWVWLEAFVKLTRDEVSGQPDGYVVSVRDISRRKEAESRLAYNASHDPLTGLPNRSLLHERLTQEIARATRTGAGFALLALDLDRFKPINDEFGHEAGDAVLRAIAERLRSAVRAQDTVARLGGDEFVVIQTTASDVPASAIRLANRLIRTASDPIDFNGLPMSVGLSVGVAIAPAAGIDADDLLRAADQALYKAKEAGRNQYCISGATSTEKKTG